MSLVDGGVDSTWQLELCEACGAHADQRSAEESAAAHADRKHRQATEALVDSIREEIAAARATNDLEALAAAARFLAFLRPELAGELPPDLADLVATHGGLE